MSKQLAWTLLKRLQGSRRWVILVNIILALALVAFVGRYLWFDLQKILYAGFPINFSSLFLALGLYGFNFAIFIIAWHRIVDCFGCPVDWKQNVFLYSYTNLTKFLPTPVWFITSRVHLYNQSGVGYRIGLAMTIVEILLHALTGLTFCALLTINPEHPVTWLHTLVLIPLAIVLYRPNWLEIPQITGGENLRPGVRRQDVIIWVTLYLLTWVVAGPFLAAVINIFVNKTPSIIELWRVWALASLVSYLATYTLGGIGILQEFTLTWLLSRFYSPGVAFLIAVGVRLTLTLGGILYGLTFSGLGIILPRLRAKSSLMRRIFSKCIRW